MHSISSRPRGDRALAAAGAAATFSIATSTVVVALFLTGESIPALVGAGPAAFFTDEAWLPTQGSFDLKPMLAGSLLVVAGALLLAVPLGWLTALWCRLHAPRAAAGFVRGALRLLSGVPSVVVGSWGLAQVVPLVARIEPPGQSLLAGVVVLALMIVPTIALTADAALGAVDPELARAAEALGLSRERAGWSVLVPAAWSGLVGGAVLAAVRAIGETMAVLLVSGNPPRMPHGIFDPIRTLPSNLAIEMAYAVGEHRSALFVTGALLFAVCTAGVLGLRRVVPGVARG